MPIKEDAVSAVSNFGVYAKEVIDTFSFFAKKLDLGFFLDST